VLAAHPDDETIGASAILGRLPDVTVVYLTDGAPRDKRFWSAGGHYSREEYARIRGREAESALEVVGIPPDRIHYLGGSDQESIFESRSLVESLSSLLCERKPDVLITHPYEGGHPDHDSAALVASLAVSTLTDKGLIAPELLEMTSYHARDGRCFMGEFLREPAAQPGSSDELIIQLSSEEYARKKCMMDCYESQTSVLRNFPLGPERLRVAREYDFARPPHQGMLWYEAMGWPITGERWRQLAARALAARREIACA
jgi:LmbE family N-acetylglucosaminyl deacetylase